jgi:TusA-related sulfurtransferase
MTDTAETADQLLRAITARDFDAIAEVVSPAARFRFLIPPGPDEVTGGAEVAARFRRWFGDADAFEIVAASVEELVDRVSVRYRFRLREEVEWKEGEQQVYVDVDDEGRIAAMDLMCSGFRSSASDASNGTHVFDAGSLGCADGLAGEFRRRMSAIPVGDLLVVVTDDPSAKEDLPPLARMMGHKVRSVESPVNGRLLMTVERGR